MRIKSTTNGTRQWRIAGSAHGSPFTIHNLTQKSKRIAMPPEENQATARVIYTRTYVKIGHVVLEKYLQTDTHRHVTIRKAILTCAEKLTYVSLIYCMEPKTKKQEREKLTSNKQICSEVLVNSLGNPCSQSRRRKGRLQW